MTEAISNLLRVLLLPKKCYPDNAIYQFMKSVYTKKRLIGPMVEVIYLLNFIINIMLIIV